MKYLTSDFYLITKDSLKSDNSITQGLCLKIFNNIICYEYLDISIKIIDKEFILTIIKILSNKNSSRPENKSVCLSLLFKIFGIEELMKKRNFNSSISSNSDELNNEINPKPSYEFDYINFFLKNEGKDILNELQLDVSEEIYIKSNRIIKKYFTFEEQ